MKLYQQWQNIVSEERTHQQQEYFWKSYFEKEKNIYQKILAEKKVKIEGKVSELAKTHDMEPHMFTGFLDGINTSLNEFLDIDELNEDSDINIDIDFQKLLFNMHDAKAEWLYTLEEWDNVFPIEKRDEIAKEYKNSKIAISNKIGRNDPCICGSGKKYKKCCGA
jgi:hypothetical protein